MKNRRFPNWQRLCFIGVMVCGLMACHASEPGYLALVGPVPLRFRAVMRVFTNQVVLPPATPEPAPAPVAVAAVKPAALPPVVLPNSPGAAENSASSSAAPVADSSPSDGAIPPQVFLKFFNKTTNGTSTITAPMQFTPPKAAESSGNSGSSATYSNTP